MPTYRTLQLSALAISVLSIVYNGAEGGVAIGLGAEAGSRSLVFFGIQSAIEVLSACIVVWRFRVIAPPGEEQKKTLSPNQLRTERIGSIVIGILLLCLALATEVTAAIALSTRSEPDSSLTGLIISASCLLCMLVLWLPKRYLARALNSAAMEGEANCSLACLQMTCVLFVGALVFRLWKGGWWVDSATALILGCLFARDGFRTLRWATSKEFDGGCCGSCKPTSPPGVALQEQYRDLCSCCMEKSECKDAKKCLCNQDTSLETGCCQPINAAGAKCCTHEIRTGEQPREAQVDTPIAASCTDGCCAPPSAEAVSEHAEGGETDAPTTPRASAIKTASVGDAGGCSCCPD